MVIRNCLLATAGKWSTRVMASSSATSSRASAVRRAGSWVKSRVILGGLPNTTSKVSLPLRQSARRRPAIPFHRTPDDGVRTAFCQRLQRPPVDWLECPIHSVLRSLHQISSGLIPASALSTFLTDTAAGMGVVNKPGNALDRPPAPTS